MSMQTTRIVETDRLWFLDNIRYFMVLLVVVIHTACGYTTYSSWWTVPDKGSIIINYTLQILDVFLMPTLFFIAGYFALPSLKKRNTLLFIGHKLKRLGLPFMLGVIIYAPIHFYIWNYARGGSYMNLWDIFLGKIESALSFKTGFISSTFQFHHHYLWFISLLLFFFIIFAIMHKIIGNLFVKSYSSEVQKPPSNKSILIVIFISIVITTIITLFMYKIFSQSSSREPWIIIISLIEFQPTRMALYILCFILGIYAFHKRWFLNGEVPGHLAFWIILSISLYFFKDWIMKNLIGNIQLKMVILYIFVHITLFFSILLTFISFGIKYWQSSSRVNRLLAENSYYIYLVHMLFVNLIQLALLKWIDGYVYLKFIIVTVSAILLSYFISNYAIKKFPRLSIAGILGIFVLALVFVKASL
jgi:glucans biosynthesis protein C